jgi:hypothetical protein
VEVVIQSFYISRRFNGKSPNVMSNMFGAGGGMLGDSPTFKITMKEYENVALKVGNKVGIEINRIDSSSGV